ncbi:gem-associated protein 8-like [Frankliniella occidentalis]|uniref:Gem-associated protein 8-like n=1 Tax=Frankliniella occidentalis TaxID=133901 RepID=A0A6J1SQH0_FRAOC|nr:gem-associated protein 8-like [Frankliniella occidentalis]
MNEKGFNIYWQNYHRAFEWRNNSQMSHWKARARALEVENALLKGYIQKGLQSGFHSGAVCRDPFENNEPCAAQEEEVVTNQDDDDYACEDIEIDEELLAFYEKTMRHKIERKKRQSLERKRESEDSHSENEQVYSMGPISTSQKSTDMTLLYGGDAPKILSMELSMQINFDMNRSKSNPLLWPNIPLRLS